MADDSDDLYCNICDVQCRNPQALVNHSRSMIHSQKIMEAEAKKQKMNASIKKQILEEKAVADKDAINTNTIHCDLCSCDCSGQISYEAHINGSRHQKNLKLSATGGMLKTGPTRKPGGGSTIKMGGNSGTMVKQQMDRVKEALIGLQYITEFRDDSLYNKEASYVCNMCEMSFNCGNMIPHVLGLKHRMNYLKEHYMNYYTIIRQNQCKKSELNSIVEEYANQIEAEEGRKSIKYRSDNKEKQKIREQMSNVSKRVQEHTLRQEAHLKRARMDYDMDMPDRGGHGEDANRGRGGPASLVGYEDDNPRSNQFATPSRANPPWAKDREESRRPGFDQGPGSREMQPIRRGRLSLAEVLDNVERMDILTEEDASAALRVSNALTNKLLEYRLGTVPSETHKDAIIEDYVQQKSSSHPSQQPPPWRGNSAGAARPPNAGYGNNGPPQAPPLYHGAPTDRSKGGPVELWRGKANPGREESAWSSSNSMEEKNQYPGAGRGRGQMGEERDNLWGAGRGRGENPAFMTGRGQPRPLMTDSAPPPVGQPRPLMTNSAPPRPLMTDSAPTPVGGRGRATPAGFNNDQPSQPSFGAGRITGGVPREGFGTNRPSGTPFGAGRGLGRNAMEESPPRPLHAQGSLQFGRPPPGLLQEAGQSRGAPAGRPTSGPPQVSGRGRGGGIPSLLGSSNGAPPEPANNSQSRAPPLLFNVGRNGYGDNLDNFSSEPKRGPPRPQAADGPPRAPWLKK